MDKPLEIRTWKIYECIGHSGPMENRFRELGEVKAKHQPDAMLKAYHRWCPMDEGMQRRLFARKVDGELREASDVARENTERRLKKLSDLGFSDAAAFAKDPKVEG